MPADVEPTPRQRAGEVGSQLPARAALTGWAALAWMGARWFAGAAADGSPLPVAVATAGHVWRRRPGVVVCEERLDPRETSVVDGVRVCSAARAACFEARYATTPVQAVTALDMACFDDLASLTELTAWVRDHPGFVGIERARRALQRAEENAWSPREVALRVLWHEARPSSRLLLNAPLFDPDGRHLGTPDLFDESAGVAAEYDGVQHLELAARSGDLRRGDRLGRAGVETARFVAGDLVPRLVASRLDDAYRRAARLPVAERRWTTAQPAWWVDTSTVAARRALSGSERQVWLTHRR